MPRLPTDAAPRVQALHWGHLPQLLRQLVVQPADGGGDRIWRQAVIGPLQRLIGRSGRRRPGDLGLVALDASDHAVGLLLAASANRRGSCWRLDLLQISDAAEGRLDLATALLREALHRTPAAVSWIARVDVHDDLLLAALRDQGFQTLQQLQVWRIEDLAHLQSVDPPLPEGIEPQPLALAQAAPELDAGTIGDGDGRDDPGEAAGAHGVLLVQAASSASLPWAAVRAAALLSSPMFRPSA